MKKRCIAFGLFLVLLSGLLSSCTTAKLSTPEADVMSTTPALTAIPAITPPLVIDQAWQDAYAEFLRENIPTGEVDFDELVEGSDVESRFEAFSAGGYPVVSFAYLYDIDKDGIPSGDE